jgi:hypothetical protein
MLGKSLIIINSQVISATPGISSSTKSVLTAIDLFGNRKIDKLREPNKIKHRLLQSFCPKFGSYRTSGSTTIRRLDGRLSTSSKNDPIVYVCVFIDVEDPDLKKFRQSMK